MPVYLDGNRKKNPPIVQQEERFEMLPFSLNFRASPGDNRDYVVKTSSAQSRGSVDLSNFCTSIKNQGNVGSCTAHAGVGLMEFFYRKNMGGKTDDLFSEKFLYYTTRVDVWRNSTEDTGAYLRDTLKSMVQYGVCLETECPYVLPGQNACNYREKPNVSAYKQALNFQVTKYARVSETNRGQCLQDLKNLLAGGYAFMGGFVCYQNVFTGSNGLIPLPRGRVVGGHAVLFVGYDDERQVFKFKNSWGSSWGDKGYGYLPYQYVLSGNLFDLWTVLQQEHDNVPFEMLKPAVRRAEFNKRLAELLVNVSQGESIEQILNEIPSNPGNVSLLAQDVAELQNFVRKVYDQLQNARNTV